MGFPVFKGEDSFAPNVLLRSNLFRATDLSNPCVFLKNEKLVTHGATPITYTGEILNQFDLDVWLNVLKRISENRGVFGNLTITSESQMLLALGRSKSGKSIEHLRSSFKKLVTATITIQKTNSLNYTGHLINEYWQDVATNKYICNISDEIVELFYPGSWSLIDNKIRSKIRRYPLSAWLHAFYTTHQSSKIPISILNIALLSGSLNQNSHSFKQNLLKSASLLNIVANEFGKKFEFRIEKNNFYVDHLFR